MPSNPEQLQKIVSQLLGELAKPAVSKGMAESSLRGTSKEIKKSSHEEQEVKKKGETPNQAKSEGNISVKTVEHKNPIHAEFNAQEMAQLRSLSAKEKLSQLSGKFKPEDLLLQNGIKQLQLLDWDNPNPEQWVQTQLVLANMPKWENLSPADRVILRETHQAILTHYYEHRADYTDVSVSARPVDISAEVNRELKYADYERYKNEQAEYDMHWEDSNPVASGAVAQVNQELRKIVGEGTEGAKLLDAAPIQSRRVVQFIQDGLASGKDIVSVGRDIADFQRKPYQPFNKPEASLDAKRVSIIVAVTTKDANLVEKVETKGGAPASAEKATSSKGQWEQEYWDEVAQQMINDKKVAPDVTPSRGGVATPDLANRLLKGSLKSKEHLWLFHNGRELTIKDPQAAQLLSDFLHDPNPVVESKEALLVRGNQLKQIVEKLPKGVERNKLNKLLERWRGRTLQQFELEKTFNSHSKEMKQIRELLGRSIEEPGDDKVGAPRSAEVNSSVGWDPAEDPIPADAKFNNLRKLVVDYNQDIQEITARLREAMNPKAGRQDTRKINAIQDELSNKIIDMLVIKIPNLDETEAAHVENLYAKLEDYRQALVKRRMEQGRGYNSLYVPEEKTRAYQLNVFLEVRDEQDRYNLSRRLLPNRLQEASDQAFRMNIQYLQSEQYRTDVRDLFKDPMNYPDIEYYSGITVDREHPENHPFYQRVDNDNLYRQFRQKITDALTYPDLLEKDYTSWQLGRLQDIGTGFAGFGEPGIMAILNNRAFNTETFDVLETLYGNLVGPNGEAIVGSGPAQEARVLEDAVNFLDAHRDLFIDKYREEYGPHAELKREHIEASVKEVHMLMALTGERAKAVRRLLTPVEGDGQGINPTAFAGEASGGDNKINQAIEPMRQFFLRWKTASEVQKIWIESNAKQEAARFGVDEKWKKIIKGSISKEQREEIVRYAFTIVSDDKDHVKNCLSVLAYNEKGKKILDPPERISDVNDKQLLRWLIMRDGSSLADPTLTGGYSYFEASWNNVEIVRGLDEMSPGVRGVGALEKLRMEAGAMFDARNNHHQLEHAQEALIKRDDADPHNDGALTNAARFMPGYVLRPLLEQKNVLAQEFVRDHFDDYDVFHDTLGQDLARPKVLTNDMEGSVSAKRPDLFFKRYELTTTMINRGLADWEDRENKPLMSLPKDHPDRLKQKGLPPIDCSRIHKVGEDWVIDDSHQMRMVVKMCNALGVSPNDYLRISKELADFALRHDVLKEAAHPLVARRLLDVRKKDARLYRLDEGPKMWSDIPEPTNSPGADRIAIGEFVRHRYIGKWSSRIANVEGFSANGGLPRWVGDQMNSWSVMVKDLVPISNAPDPKTWEGHTDSYANTIVNTGGADARAKVAHMLTLSYLHGNRMFLSEDFRGTSDEATTRDISINQEVGGQGFKALAMNEADHVLHTGERIAGGKFHIIFPHLDHVTMKQAKLVIPIAKWPNFVNKFGEKMGEKLPNRITIGNKEYRINLGKKVERFFNGEITMKTVTAYRVIAFLGLGGLFVLFEGFNSLRKGLADGSGGSAGGGQSHPS